MFIYFVLSLHLLGRSGFAFDAPPSGGTSHTTQLDMPSSSDEIWVSGQRNMFDPHILLAQFSRHQADEDLIIIEADRIFDTIESMNYTVNPETKYFVFFADNFPFFRSRSTQLDNEVYDYRLPTSGYLHLKTFRFVVDPTDQKLKAVVAMSSFL